MDTALCQPMSGKWHYVRDIAIKMLPNCSCNGPAKSALSKDYIKCKLVLLLICYNYSYRHRCARIANQSSRQLCFCKNCDMTTAVSNKTEKRPFQAYFDILRKLYQPNILWHEGHVSEPRQHLLDDSFGVQGCELVNPWKA